MSETLPVVKSDSITELFKQIPAVNEITTKLERASTACNSLLDDLKAPADDEEFESNNQVLAQVREQYGKMMELRKPITQQVDAISDMLISFERPFNPAAKTNKYLEKRKLQEQYQQEKLERTRLAQQEAAKRKDIENHKVDLKMQIMSNLNITVTEAVKKAEAFASSFFATLTLETFTDLTEKFKRQTPKLKTETYQSCFAVTYRTDYLTDEEFRKLVESIVAEETYDIWNAKVKEAVAPVLNNWIARIPEYKEQLQARASAKSEEDRLRIENEQKAKAEKEAQARQKEIEDAAEKERNKIQAQANLDKMGNEFQAQAVTQSLEDAGSVKNVLKFTDPKTQGKALFEIMYHCFMHKDFPGFQKRDSKKALMFDDKGRPVYIEAVQFWVDFFINKKIDVEIAGTKVYEDSKITIRK